MNKADNESLKDYLNDKVFNEAESITIEPQIEDVEGFKEFMKKYENGLDIERSAVKNLE
jgi:hypothetical protein